MEKKNKKMYLIFLIGFLIGVAGFSSCFFMYINSPKPIEINYGDKGEEISSGLFFKSIDKSVYLEKVMPTLDKFGVLEKGFSFTIQNNSVRDIDYVLAVIDVDSTIPNNNIRYELTKDDKVIGIYSLSEDGTIEKSTINQNQEIKYTIKIWLDYNSEIKVGKFNKKISIGEISVDESINKPTLTNGMIPVYYDDSTNNWYKTVETNEYNKWYSYDENKWANVVTVNSNKRKYYQESPSDTKIEMDDINSMWVWIPRFNYSLNNEKININFVKKNEPSYVAFKFNDQELDGFWFSKFESGMKSDSGCITSSLTSVCNNSNNKLYFVPNYPFATKMTMANMFYAIRKMELKGNIYGFNGTGTSVNYDGTMKNDNNDIDIHMVRNSEWQAVAILSDSKYGINKQIINNNSTVTGKAYYQNEEVNYNVLGKGDLASTTGNVTGIYDMSGGKREYVMIDNSELSIFNKNSNSGFNGVVKEYYYDKEFNSLDLTLKLRNKYGNENMINSEPITRGGYKSVGNIFNLFGTTDYISKISVETNSRACLMIFKGEE